MAKTQHSIEIVADKLADAIEHEVDLLATFLRPKGERPPFSKRVNLDWWRRHRSDEFGLAVIATLEPAEIMALDAALAADIEQERMAPMLGA